jgi:acetoin utilization protein AcuB
MNLFDPISKIMTRGVISISPDDSLAKVEEVFSEERIHHLPIVDKGQLVGMVSKSDFLLFKHGFSDPDKDPQESKYRGRVYKAKDIMTSKLATLEMSDRINVALEVFNKNLFHALPVLDNGILVGIVTTFDIIKQISIDEGVVAKY